MRTQFLSLNWPQNRLQTFLQMIILILQVSPFHWRHLPVLIIFNQPIPLHGIIIYRVHSQTLANWIRWILYWFLRHLPGQWVSLNLFCCLETVIRVGVCYCSLTVGSEFWGKFQLWVRLCYWDTLFLAIIH